MYWRTVFQVMTVCLVPYLADLWRQMAQVGAHQEQIWPQHVSDAVMTPVCCSQPHKALQRVKAKETTNVKGRRELFFFFKEDSQSMSISENEVMWCYCASQVSCVNQVWAFCWEIYDLENLSSNAAKGVPSVLVPQQSTLNQYMTIQYHHSYLTKINIRDVTLPHYKHVIILCSQITIFFIFLQGGQNEISYKL